ncbi:Glycine zipper 2TM domain protein [Pseudobythopirellula maris]|uniref:Glycine zipper 2TM domain protein n=1 Tax=Pseudobythopirellula maris TaxID=2527991 RepID=A0A5C5ZVD9_9BACT|nr:glycine zipper domain-containing protein [Pseudobythopirellula maris]TWT90901.1 Glycine zipper 2TM domain protein [Pseudobythopirellula maris]
MSRTSFVLSLLAAALAADSALAQYGYQPPPSYYHNDQAEGTVVGGGLGAITGALVGGRGNKTEGALVGAAIGAITGNLVGKSKDQADQRAVAYGTAAAAQANQQAAAQAVTNADLAGMARAGLGDDLIIGAIRSRGGRFDLSPNGLIVLKQSGVSDRVILAAQGMSTDSYVPAPQPATVIARPYYPEPRVNVIYTAPRPRPRPHYRAGFNYHHHW